MPSLRRTVSLVSVAVTTLVIGTASSAAAESLQQCIDQAENHGGEPPTCTEVNGKWVASWPDDVSGGGGLGGFVIVFIIAALISVAIGVWKVTTARRLAVASGMDPNLATGMTLLTDTGLEATYIAANVRGTTPASPAEQATTATRLADLKGLLDQGLITQAEYDGRRRAIIDAV